MNPRINKLSRILGLFSILVAGYHNCFSQDAYMNIIDTSRGGLFKNFVGIKFFAADIGAKSLNQDLEFQKASNNLGFVYTFQHDMNVRNLNNFFNIGLGTEENVGKHLSINFFNTSLGYIQGAWDWNINAGVGYFINLNKQQTMRLNASLNIGFESITYSFGDYYDSTQLGFVIDGSNVGTAIKGVKYVNDIWTISPGIEFTYRRSSIDFFAGIYYNYVFTHSEEINFYRTRIPVSEGIYYNQTPGATPPGEAVSGNVINLNKYMIQIGIIREFGI